MEEELRELISEVELQRRVLLIFLRVLIKRVCIDVPDFRAERLIEELYVLRAMLPGIDSADPQVRAQGEALARQWNRLLQVVEQAARDADSERGA